MANFSVTVKNKEKQLLSGVTVTANWEFFGSAQKAEVITNEQGIANFNLNVYNTTINLVASKSGSIDKESIFINLLGWAQPDKIEMILEFKPFEQIQDSTDKGVKFVTDNIRTIVIVGSIVGSLAAVIYLMSYAKGDRKINLPSMPKLNLKNKVKKHSED